MNTENAKQVIVNLKSSVPYCRSGDADAKAEFVTLTKPKAKYIHLISVIKQGLQKSSLNLSQNTIIKQHQKELEEKESKADKKNEKDEKLNAEDVIQVLYSGSDQKELTQVILTANELLCSGCVLVEGEVRMTKIILNELDPEDYEAILGSLIVNFISPSL